MQQTTNALELHPMKKIEIIVTGDQTQFVRDLMERTGITGYTMIRDVAGMGHHGFHEGSTTRAAWSSTSRSPRRTPSAGS